jgi:hypothetical protein
LCFRSSIPCPPVHLSTLGVPPHDDPPKTRGQDGSLLLSCKTLPFSTSCRFIPALWVSSFLTDTALRPGRYFNTRPVFWMNLQVRYDLEVAEDKLAVRVARDAQPMEAAAV